MLYSSQYARKDLESLGRYYLEKTAAMQKSAVFGNLIGKGLMGLGKGMFNLGKGAGKAAWNLSGKLPGGRVGTAMNAYGLYSSVSGARESARPVQSGLRTGGRFNQTSV